LGVASILSDALPPGVTMNEPRTLFITGATGLVGSHAVEEARRRGFRVKALVRRSSDTRWLDAQGVEKIEGDLEDAGALRRGVQGADWVFNCAAKVGDWGSLEEFRRLNVEAFRLLLDAASESGVERFVHVSSLGVYEGRDHFGTDETTPPASEALDGYTRSKVEAEAMALRYVKELGLPLAVVRPGFIYGERDRTVLPKLVDSLRTGRFAYFGSGDQALNCIYAKNLVAALFLAAESPAAIGEVFNVTDGPRVSKKQFIGRVAELAGLRPPRRRIPLWLAWTLAILMERRARRKGATTPPLVNKARYKFLGLNLDYSIEKARRVLGYHPPFTTEQGLIAAMADFQAAPAPKPEAVGAR
jgi:nucleoside-diphosphate-sugar epimerase